MADQAQKTAAIPAEGKMPAEKPSSAPVIPLPLNKAKKAVKAGVVKGLRPQAWRRRLLAISFFIMVVLPVAFGSVYFLVIASDRYAASAGFSVRSMDPAIGGTDLLSSLGGFSSGSSTTTDSYIILEYLKSRELVEKLMQEVEFQEAYGNENIDFLYRLDMSKPIEDILDYWDWMITTSFDNASSIITFEVQAFTPGDAEKVAALIVKYCQELINNLSEQARKDTLRFSEREASLAEARLKLIREELRDFRASSSAVDPAATAEAQLTLTTELEQRLIEHRTQLTTLQTTLSPNAPSIQQLKKQIASITAELKAKKSEIGGQSGSAGDGNFNLSFLLANFEKLKVEQEFAQRAYTVALASLEQARVEALRQQRFLAVFANPTKPQDAIYPKRILDVFLVFFAAFVIWGISVLLAYSVRDHMR